MCALPSQEPALVTSIISDKAKLVRSGKGYVAVYNITCTVLQRWFPDTAGLACVLQCSSVSANYSTGVVCVIVGKIICDYNQSRVCSIVRNNVAACLLLALQPGLLLHHKPSPSVTRFSSVSLLVLIFGH